MRNSESKRGRNQLIPTVCLFILGFLLATISCVAQDPTRGRPANVPPEYIVTPFGYMHPSCVVHVRQGEKVGQDMLLRHSDGTTEDIPA